MSHRLGINQFHLEKTRRQRAEDERDGLFSRIGELERERDQFQGQSDQWRCKYEKCIDENDTLQSLIEGLRSNLTVSIIFIQQYNHSSRKFRALTKICV